MEVITVSHRLPDDDPKTIWQNQTIQGASVTVEQLRDRAQTLDRKMRRGTFIGGMSFVLHLLCHVLQQVVDRPEFTGWIGVVEVGTLAIVLLYWPFQYASLANRPLSVVPHAGAAPGLEFYRRQLELRRDWFPEYYPSGFTPILIGFIFVIHTLRYPAYMIPIGVLWTVVGVFLYVRKRRERPVILRELEELNAFRRSQS
jgi:hypothetical protein